MRANQLVIPVVVLFTLILGGCANRQSFHESFMSGVVADVTENGALVCISGQSDIQPGTLLDVYRLQQGTNTVIHDSLAYQRIHTGQVKVTQVIDEHFAEVTLVKGRIRKHNMVETTQSH